ncbi:MAG: hypothetical protein HRT40_04970 [Campylobacteraceae bacterium]|nr:hypothetical protein [Campylobacteraceae bacterium]
MFHLQDNPKENYLVLYIDTESADTENIKEYRFNSPILKLWWYKNVAN